MIGLGVHAVVYAAVNALLVFVWVATTGSVDELSAIRAEPGSAWRDHAFWPMWVIVAWGTALAIHAGTWALVSVLGGPARRRRRRLARQGERLAVHSARMATGLFHHAVADPASARTAPGRQRVAVVFTDIVGSTDLAEQLGDHEWSVVLAEHRRTVRSLLAAHRGTEVGTQGDGFLLRFDAAADAVNAAVALQQRLDADRAGGRFTPQIRVGVHVGEATDDDGDLVGRVVNLAARVTTAAEPGEILVTEPVADQLATAAGLEDRGLVPLRGVTQPRHLLAVRWRDDDESVAPTDVITLP